jgi:nitrite reductase/ring-hydroxylating ferredoxin subunit
MNSLRPDEPVVESPVPSTRREILANGLALTAGLTVLGPLVGCLAGCATDKKEHSAAITSGVVSLGPATDYPAGTVSSKFLAQYGIAIANDSGPVLVIRPVCTHRGCLAAWDEEQNQFVCPCHGSHYNLLGQVLKGPARQPMAGLPATRNADGTLSIDLTRLYALAPVQKK